MLISKVPIPGTVGSDYCFTFGIFVLHASFTPFLLFTLYLPPSSVSLSYFILGVPKLGVGDNTRVPHLLYRSERNSFFSLCDNNDLFWKHSAVK